MHAELSLLLQSCLTLCDLMDVARQAPLSLGLSRQEYWSGLPFPPPGHLPKLGIEPGLLHWEADSLLSGATREVPYEILRVVKFTKKSKVGFWGI